MAGATMIGQLAASAVSWQQQGRQVVDGLRQAAQSSQPGVVTELDQLGASYQP